MKKLAGLVVVVFLVGCMSAPVPRTIVSSWTIDKPYDQIWSAIVEVFAEKNLTISAMEKVSGLISTKEISFGADPNGFSDCGGMGINVVNDKIGKFNVFLKQMPDGTCQMHVNAFFLMTSYSALDTHRTLYTTNCVSTGKLEAEIWTSVLEKIQSK